MDSERIMSRAVILVALLLGLVQAGPFGQTKKDGNDLERLCTNQTIQLERLSHLDELVQKLDDDLGGQCHPNTRSALRDLKQVVDDSKGKECSMESIGHYRDFYLRYLDRSKATEVKVDEASETSSDETKGKKKAKKVQKKPKLPAPLRQFALAYGIQLSGVCRLNMIRVLLKDSVKVVGADDFKRPELRELLAANGSIAETVGFTSSKPDDVFLPGDLFSMLESEMVEGEKIVFKVKASAFLKRVKTICERRLMPVYRPLMVPVARLANLGFEHRKKLLEKEIKEAKAAGEATGEVVGWWTRALFLCELTSTMQLIETAEDAKRAEGNDATRVCVANGSNSACTLAGRDLLEAAEVNVDDIEQVQFEPNLSIEMPDKIFGSLSKKYATAMVLTNMDEANNARLRMAKKIFANTAKLLVRYKLISFVQGMKKLIDKSFEMGESVDRNGKKDISKNLVASVNNMINNQLSPETAVSCDSCEKNAAPAGVVWGLMAMIIIFLVVAGIIMGTQGTG